MKRNQIAAHVLKTALAASALLLAGGAVHAAQQINLTAAPALTTLPDGNVVPMWGYTCGAVATDGATATCRALNPAVQAANTNSSTGSSGLWSPVVITIPTGQDLQINLTNALGFAAGSGVNNIPTSLTIVGQIGGGLGGASPATYGYVASPTHPQQGQTWPIANAAGTVFAPPAQLDRVQSFATEVAAGNTATLCWGACGAKLPALKPGTYLIESGTHPSIQAPMGLYGILVVTTAPTSSAGAETGTGTAYPLSSLTMSTTPSYPAGVTYDAEVPVLLSEIDPVLNQGIQTAVTSAGFAENASQVLGNAITSVTLASDGGGSGYTIATATGTTSNGTLPITFSPSSACKLLPSGTATITNGVVTAISVAQIATANAGTAYGTGCIEAVGASVAGGTTPAQISVTMSSTSFGTQCSAAPGASAPAAACYPPAVNYTPEYYLVNGSAFDKTHAANSLYPTTPGTLTGNNVLVRLVNAGLRLHVPAIIGATTTTSYSPAGSIAAKPIPGLTLVAEDGNPVPGVPRVQSEVIMPAGKTYDILINAVAASTPVSVTTPIVLGATAFTVSGTVPAGLTVGATLADISGLIPSGTSVTKIVPGTDSTGGAIYTVTMSAAATGASASDTVSATATTAALPIFDRELSLSGATINRDAGMLAYIGSNSTAVVPAAPALAKAVANADSYNVLLAVNSQNQGVNISDPSKGVIANDINVYGVTLLTQAASGIVSLNRNGTFTYTPNSGSAATSDSFTYCANGTVTALGGSCSSGITATVSLGADKLTDAGASCGTLTFNATTASSYTVNPPGVLAACTDAANLTMTVKGATATVPVSVAMTGGPGAGTALIDANGGFQATVNMPGTYTFAISAVNSLGLGTPAAGTVTITFPTASGLSVNVVDGADKVTQITDYRWIIEEDKTFFVDPNCTSQPLPAGCPTVNSQGSQFNYGTSFHASAMTVVAQGCTGQLSCESGQSLQGVAAVCDVGNGVCRTTGTQFQTLSPSQVYLDPTKRYYISVLPGDAANPFGAGFLGSAQCASTIGLTPAGTNGQVSVPSGTCGHGMGGSPINKGQKNVIVLTQPSPYPTAHVTAFIYEDDYPLNGEHDAGGGVDVLAAQEPGLGGFQILLQDVAGATGDMTGTPSVDMFNQPLSNAMAGTIDPVTLLDACPISKSVTSNALAASGLSLSALIAGGATTFTVSGAVPAGLTVGATLADNSGVIPSGTSVTKIAPGTNSTGGAIYTVTMSAAATGASATDTVTVTGAQAGITGQVVTCPKYESDGQTLSPLAGMVMINNLYPGRYSVQAIPGADRIARGEEWLQTNTLDGQKGHDAFLRIGEPAYFQEYGPAGFHVNIGYANPQIINNRRHNAGNSGWCDDASLNSLTNGNGALVGKLDCSNSVDGYDYLARMSRTPDERLYSSGSRAGLAFTQCYAALSDPDGATFAFTKCDPVSGHFYFGPSSPGANDGVPPGNWMVTIFDQWNDQIIDGISTPVGVACAATQGSGLCSATNAATGVAVNKATGTNQAIHLGEVATHQWQANVYTKTFLDMTGTGLWQDSAGAGKPPLILPSTNVRFRDGSISNVGSGLGWVNFNEVFPLFNWYVIETDDTRFKNTGVHIVYDAGGPVDNSSPGSVPCVSAVYSSGVNPCGNSVIGSGLANTYEKIPLPTDLRIPGAVYCASADCFGKSEAAQQMYLSGASVASTLLSDPLPANSYTNDPANGGVIFTTGFSTGRIDPPLWWGTYGWQGYSGQANFIEWGKKPFVPGETGGIRGHVVYASTRPYDNPALLLQNQWEPLVPHVTVNLYKQTFAADGVTPQLTLIDHTTTTSWDDWAQGYRTDANGNLVISTGTEGGAIPNMSCPGQSTADLFFYGIKNQPQWLDFYDNVLHNPSGTSAALTQAAYNSQFKCYDGMHSWNQLVPAPYDGMYMFPSVTGFDPTTGRPSDTNCTACVTNVDATDPYRYGGTTTLGTPFVNGVQAAANANLARSAGTPVLPAGNYVVEVVVPPGYQLVKEEDKNILIGDNFIAPAVTQFPGLGTNVFILPDQAAIGSTKNAANAQNPTVALGRNVLPNSETDTFMQEQYWPCVGAPRQVPDFISLFPQSQEVAPFAGAIRNLCDRKAVTLSDQSSALAKFYIFTPTHIAGHFTGIILDDFTSEFDPYSPQFGEKFAPSYLPVSIKDWAGNEVTRVYSDQFGLYNGLSYSTWEVNPPNPTGYAPTMMIACMNDAGSGTVSPWWDANAVGTVSTKRDPFYEYGYSQFCYELPFMPGRTGYFDTPVTPDAAFTDGYNHPDCSYPNLTPAISSVTSPDIAGPWVSTAGHSLTINALGDQQVENYGYSGPSITKAPYNAQQITRHYGFGVSPGAVTIGGVAATVNSWSDASINVTVPSGIPACEIQQQPQYSNLAPTITTVTDSLTASLARRSDTFTLTALPANLNNVDLTTGNTTVSLSDSAGAIPSGTTVTSITSRTRQGTTTYTITMSANASVSATNDSITATITSSTPPAPTACGQLQITTATGQTSVDTVTVTVGGKTPTVLATGKTIQSAIDAASPGDMIIVPPGVYSEMVIMWKPVRLQGVGAASSIVDANTQPAGKLLNPWRTRIDCLFGLTTAGRPRIDNDMSCAAGWTNATGYQTTSVDSRIDDAQFPTIMVDRLPFEAVLGWDATLNGNLAEQSIEPSLMGAEEGAAITVLGKGVRFGDVSANPTAVLDAFGSANGAIYPVNTQLLTADDCQANTTLPVTAVSATNPTETFARRAVGGTDKTNRYPGNFLCNPSAIDGLGLRDASQGGGGIYVHAYAHYLQVANNRVYNNLGTLSGGITIGQGEHPDANLTGTAAVITAPNSCEDQLGTNPNTTNAAMPFCFDLHVNVHNNAVYENVSLGDELFSSTPAGAGGISVNTGADYYTMTNNWVCGNLSSGDGGGVSHIGFIKNGTIANNQILFNKSANPSISTNGAGLLVMGAPDVDPTCGANNDQDCVALPSTVTPSDGSGPGLVVNANLILGNSADAGSGGGVRLQNINGNDVVRFPNSSFDQGCTTRFQNGKRVTTCTEPYTSFWNSVELTNNIIVNNVAGWDGGGISLQDALNVAIVNNTVAHNDSTATAGPLFGSLFAPMSSAPSTQVGCYATANGVSGAAGTVTGVASCPQVAGVVSVTNSAILQANTANSGTSILTCPAAYGGTGCYAYSAPLIFNDLVWQNRSFVVTTGGLGSGNGNQQQVVTLMNADPAFPASNSGSASNPTSIQSQTSTGMCPTSGSAYWDLGVRGDVGPHTPQAGGMQLHPYNSAIDDLTLYANTGTTAYNNVGIASTPTFAAGFVAAYCNGGRTPPEAGGQGWFVPPGTNETNGSINGGTGQANGTNPMYFSLVATATTDEGNNWINMRWGPLSLTNPANDTSNGTAPQYLGNYAIGGSSGAIGKGSGTVGGVTAPPADYFGNPRGSRIDIGAVAYVPPPAQIGIAASASPNVQTGQSATITLTVTNTAASGSQGLLVTNLTFTAANSFITQTGTTCPATGSGVAVGSSCTVTLKFAPTGGGFSGATAQAATLSIGSNASNGAQSVTVSGTAWPALATLSPSPVLFGTVGDGAPNSAPVTLQNTGYGPLYLESVAAAASAGSSGYGVGAGGSCSTSVALAPGKSCTVVATFDPAVSGSDSGTLTVNVGAYAGTTNGTLEQTTTLTVGLSGTGATPTGNIAPAGPAQAYAFTPALAVGKTATSTIWTVTNTSAFAISPTITAGTGSTQGQFALSGCAGAVAAGGTCSFTLSFAPTSAGSASGSFTIALGTATLATIGTTGTGLAPAPVLTGQTSLGTGATGTTTLTLTNTNTGTALPFTISANGIGVTVTNGTGFNSGNATYTVLAGGTCTSGKTIAVGASCTVIIGLTDTHATRRNTTATVTVTGTEQGTTTPSFSASLGISGS